MTDRDLPALYNLASVYVGASRRSERLGVEGFGIALVEASACGLPVVAARPCRTIAATGAPDQRESLPMLSKKSPSRAIAK